MLTLTRLALSTLLALPASMFVTACFEDGTPGNPRDGGIDAMVIDARGPRDCGCTNPPEDAPDPGVDPFPSPEGGELRLERFQLGPDDTDAELAAQALFFKGQEPPLRSLSGVPISLRADLTDAGYTCLDYRSGTNFDNGKSDQAQDIADTREYYDVGATATLTNADDAGDVITLDRFLSAEDPAAATDRSSGLVHDVLYRAPVATAVARNARYLPAIAGSASYPALDLVFGESAVGEELTGPDGRGTPQIYMPSAFTLTSPAEADFYGDGALVFTRGQDLSITYQPDPVLPTDWPTIMPFISFVDGAGMVAAVCFEISPGQLENGQFTVPYEVLDVVSAGPGGQAIFGRMVHVAWTSAPDVTRLDLIGIESKVSPGFVIQDAPRSRQ